MSVAFPPARARAKGHVTQHAIQTVTGSTRISSPHMASKATTDPSATPHSITTKEATLSAVSSRPSTSRDPASSSIPLNKATAERHTEDTVQARLDPLSILSTSGVRAVSTDPTAPLREAPGRRRRGRARMKRVSMGTISNKVARRRPKTGKKNDSTVE